MHTIFHLSIDWNKDADKNFTKFWPGWDERIIETNAKKEYNIQDIGTNYKYICISYIYSIIKYNST